MLYFLFYLAVANAWLISDLPASAIYRFLKLNMFKHVRGQNLMVHSYDQLESGLPLGLACKKWEKPKNLN